MTKIVKLVNTTSRSLPLPLCRNLRGGNIRGGTAHHGTNAVLERPRGEAALGQNGVALLLQLLLHLVEDLAVLAEDLHEVLHQRAGVVHPFFHVEVDLLHAVLQLDARRPRPRHVQVLARRPALQVAQHELVVAPHDAVDQARRRHALRALRRDEAPFQKQNQKHVIRVCTSDQIRSRYPAS